MDREVFERMVDEEFQKLPERFRSVLENIHIVVEDEPRNGVGKRAGTSKGHLLLGLYEGVPLTRRGSDYGVRPVVPDRITLFRKNLEAIVRTEAELRTQVAMTLIHEIAHYLGMSEAEIRDAGY